MTQSMSRFKYSAPVFSYVPKPMKRRLVALRKIDSRRYSESTVIERCLKECLEAIEQEARKMQNHAA